jgi:hypothetical protein
MYCVQGDEARRWEMGGKGGERWEEEVREADQTGKMRVARVGDNSQMPKEGFFSSP